MTQHLWLPQPTGVPTPAELAAYLKQAAWTNTKADSHWAEYSKSIEGEKVTLEVPQRVAARDYYRAVAVLIQDLSRLEQRKTGLLVKEIRTSTVDVIRLGLSGASTQDGGIPIDAGRRVYSAARDLLLAGACSVVEPRAVFVKRKPDEAMALLSRARFGQTEVGSFVLTMECSVPPQLGQLALVDADDPDAPFERKTSLLLARALQNTENAVRRSTAADSLDPFRESIASGVSANLCDAIAEMLDATSADVLRAGFSFASRRPVDLLVPRSVSFSADTSEILREASKQLRDEASYPNTEFEGTVVKLNSQDSSTGGEVVLRGVVDGSSRNIRVSLSALAYETAIRAHKDGSLVGCTGDLARVGRSWALASPHAFTVLEKLDD